MTDNEIRFRAVIEAAWIALNHAKPDSDDPEVAFRINLARQLCDAAHRRDWTKAVPHYRPPIDRRLWLEDIRGTIGKETGI